MWVLDFIAPIIGLFVAGTVASIARKGFSVFLSAVFGVLAGGLTWLVAMTVVMSWMLR